MNDLFANVNGDAIARTEEASASRRPVGVASVDVASTRSDRTGSPIAVLCIEGRDDIRACVRDMVIGALEPLSAVVGTVSSASDALALLEAIRFDLVVADLPNGTPVLDFLRQKRPEDVDRFVFFTGSDDEARGIHPKTIEKGIRVEDFARQLRRMTLGLGSR